MTSRLTVALALCASLAFVDAAGLHAQELNATEREIVSWIEEHHDESVDFLERVVNINSGTMNHEGVREVGRVFRAALDSLGMDTRWIDLPEEVTRASHLFARTTGDEGRSMLLIGHLDTVFEEDSPFQTFQRDGRRATGPGVSDMKGGDVVILYALRALAEVGVLHDGDVTVALIGDEERPGEPLDATRGPLIEAGRRAEVALGFEGAVRDENGEYGTVARRSSSEWTLEVTGRQAHSSGIFGEDTGAGAIFEASRILNAFYEEVRGPEYLTFNAGVVLGGTDVRFDDVQSRGTAFGKTNVVPRTAVVSGGIRTISEDQLARARDRMRSVVERSLPRTSATIHFADGYPPMSPTEANRRLLELYSAVSQDLGGAALKALDPARRGAADISFVAPHVDAALAGIGVHGGGAHGPDEWVDLASMEEQTRRAALLIYRLIRDRTAS